MGWGVMWWVEWNGKWRAVCIISHTHTHPTGSPRWGNGIANMVCAVFGGLHVATLIRCRMRHEITGAPLVPHRTNRSLMFSAVDIPAGTGHYVQSPSPSQNYSTMFGTACASEPEEESTLESLAPLPTAALKHRFEYLMGVAKARNDSSAGEPGLLRRVVHDFLQATHWAAPSAARPQRGTNIGFLTPKRWASTRSVLTCPLT